MLAKASIFLFKPEVELQLNYVSCLKTFLALLNFERHFLTFSKSLETLRSDCTEVNEYVRTAVVLSDETETFLFVEPLNDTGRFSHDNILIKKIIRKMRMLARKRITYVRNNYEWKNFMT